MRQPLVELVRRYAEDWLDAADPSVCAEILDPGYALHIGGQVLAGRDDAYIPATMAQLEQFPDLVLVVHDLLVGPDRVAMRFSEHGTSTRHDGRQATWGGVVLFRGDGERLVEAWVEEDYLARRAQLADQPCAPIPPVATAPWDQSPAEPDPAAEAVVRGWLGERGADDAVAYDDMAAGVAAPLLDVGAADVHELFSTGPRVAFAASQHGQVREGAGEGRAGTLHLAGIVDVAGDRVAGGHVIRDRLGLQRALQRTSADGGGTDS